MSGLRFTGAASVRSHATLGSPPCHPSSVNVPRHRALLRTQTTGWIYPRVPGRKRGLAEDVLSLVFAVIVLAASAHDKTSGLAMLDQAADHTGGTVEKAMGDVGFHSQVVTVGADRASTSRSFNATRRRRGLFRRRSDGGSSRPTGPLILHRRLVRDRGPPPASPTASRLARRTCPSTRTTPAYLPSSTTPPDRCGPGASAKPRPRTAAGLRRRGLHTAHAGRVEAGAPRRRCSAACPASLSRSPYSVTSRTSPHSHPRTCVGRPSKYGSGRTQRRTSRRPCTRHWPALTRRTSVMPGPASSHRRRDLDHEVVSQRASPEPRRSGPTCGPCREPPGTRRGADPPCGP